MKTLLLCFLYLFAASGQDPAKDKVIYINEITVEGNQKTRDEIILREMLFGAGDVVPDSLFGQQLEQSRQLVMNTGLFNDAEITVEEEGDNKVNIRIVVAETWYLYPVPIFELIDRNFNVWWVEQNRSLQRINFGIEFTHTNFSGQRDKLKLNAKHGYTQSYSLQYSLPFIDRAQTLGAALDVSFARNRELNYNSVDNKQLFFKDPDDRFIYQRFWADVGLVYRPGHHLFHSFRARFQQNRIGELVATELNPDFFLDGRKLQRAFFLQYSFAYDRRDVRSYPLSGNMFSAEILKEGLGFYKDRNGLTLKANYDQYFSLNRRWSAGFLLSTKLSLIRRQQPFNEYRAFGFGRNNLPGYEYYVINGMDLVVAKAFLRFCLLQKDIKFGKYIPLESFRKMPVKVYLALNQGTGFVNDPYTSAINPMSNQALWGGGLGLDIVMYYDKVFRVQYSYNHLLEHGLFLHFEANI